MFHWNPCIFFNFWSHFGPNLSHLSHLSRSQGGCPGPNLVPRPRSSLYASDVGRGGPGGRPPPPASGLCPYFPNIFPIFCPYSFKFCLPDTFHWSDTLRPALKSGKSTIPDNIRYLRLPKTWIFDQKRYIFFCFPDFSGCFVHFSAL